MLTLAFTIHSFMWEPSSEQGTKHFHCFYIKTDVMRSLLQLVIWSGIKTLFLTLEL